MNSFRSVAVLCLAFGVVAPAFAIPPRLVRPAVRILDAGQVRKRDEVLIQLVGHKIPTVALAERIVSPTNSATNNIGFQFAADEPLPAAIANNPAEAEAINEAEASVAGATRPAPNRRDGDGFSELQPAPPARSGRSESRSLNNHQTSPSNDLLAAMVRTGDVQFRNAPLGDVVFVLSEQWQINIVASDDVEGEVSGTFRGTPLWEVLDSLLLSTGYGYQRVGQSLVILSKDEVDPSAGFTRGELNMDHDVRGSAILTADQTFDPSLGTSSASIATKIGHDEVAFFSPQYTEAEMLSKPLIEAFEGTSVKIAVYPEENRIMVLGSADQIASATNMIEQLDRPRAQVRITALIYDVALTEIRNIGLNVSRDALGITGLANEGIAAQTESISDFFTASSNLVNGGSSIGLRTIQSATSTSLLLEALSSNSESKLLADPSITVGDRHDASIRIVERIPIITANPLENSNAVFTQTQFEEAGIILNVLPRISRDGTIEMVVKPEFSVVTEILATGPRIDSRTAETTVRVGDGQMFVLGGLRQKRLVENVRGIPLLKDLKYVGRLFRGHSTEIRESELVVFLKPEIVHGCQTVLPRERRAYEVGNEILNRIPYAEDLPQTPCCCDPSCPNHHPTPRINPGSEGLIDSW